MKRSRDPYQYLTTDQEDALEKRLLHKALVLANAPECWPFIQSALVMLASIGVVAGLWWMVSSIAWSGFAFLLMLAFASWDRFVLWTLPRRRISFGPPETQWFVLAVPRLAVWSACGFLAGALSALSALAIAATINFMASIALAWGAWSEPARVQVSRIRVESPRHSRNPGRVLRVLHISDLHIERLGRREDQVIQHVHRLHPDLIVLTGDYVNLSYVEDPISHEHVRRVLSQLSASYGVYAVLGSPPVDRQSAEDFRGLHIHLLRDAFIRVPIGGSSAIALIGLDCSHDPEIDEVQLAALCAGINPTDYRILLYHSPDLAPAAVRYGIDLYLCGHTHGGQIRLPLYGALITSSRLGKRFEKGYYTLNGMILYVSRGVGLEGMGAPRVRFLCSPEITLLELML